MRVIAGTARGMTLLVPRSDLRPTMDMVKAAIFSSLHDFVIGAHVLDLFAGTGSLGIEALSRGAASATFVESEPHALKSIEKNLAKAKFTGTIQPMDIFRYLDRFAATASFDLIIADPPYAKAPGERDFTPELLAAEFLQRALKPGGIFVLEHLPGVKLPLGRVWESLRDKSYGATAVTFLRLRNQGAIVAES